MEKETTAGVRRPIVYKTLAGRRSDRGRIRHPFLDLKALRLQTQTMRQPRRTREGFHWTPSEGLCAGTPCIGVVEPAQKVGKTGTVYDAVVIGAGYAGLTAARDLSISGRLEMVCGIRKQEHLLT